MTLAFHSPITPDLVHGAVELERTQAGLLPHRLPAWARAQCPDAQLAMSEAQPSGVRLALRTAATVLELVTLPTKRRYGAMAPRPDGLYDLLVDGRLVQQASAAGGNIMDIDMLSGSGKVRPGEPQTLRFKGLPPGDKRVEIWLPHDETTELVALRADAPFVPRASGGQRRWLHHGSSISQGSNAISPTGIWPVVAAQLADVDLLNLGFGGSALLDPFTARTIRDLPADLISLKLGINIVNTDLMRLRAFGPAVHGFLDTIREGHRTTPFLQTYAKLSVVNFSAGFLLHRGRFHLVRVHKASAFPSTGRCGGTHRHFSQIDCCVDVPIMQRAAADATPLSHCQVKRIKPMAAARACLTARVPTVDDDDLSATPCCLVLYLTAQFAKSHVCNRPRQTVILKHAFHVEIFDTDGVKAAGQIVT